MLGLSPKQKALVTMMLVIGGAILANGILKVTLSGADVLSEGFVLHNVIFVISQGQPITYTQAKTTVDPIRSVEGNIDTPINHKNGTISGNIHSIFKLQTREAWAAENVIRYNITSIITGTNKLVDIFFFTTDNATRSIEDIKKMGHLEFKDAYANEGVIPLIKDNDYRWSNLGEFHMPLKTELSFAGSYGVENTAYPMGTETLVELEIASVKIQADASRALIDQVNNTTKTNHKIEGLTWILISVIPIGFGFEIILREYYHNKQKPRTHMEFLR